MKEEEVLNNDRIFSMLKLVVIRPTSTKKKKKKKKLQPHTLVDEETLNRFSLELLHQRMVTISRLTFGQKPENQPDRSGGHISTEDAAMKRISALLSQEDVPMPKRPGLCK